MFKSTSELRDFVAALRIPESRRQLVEAELFDHLDSRIAAELAAGEDPAAAERAALAALGNPDQLRASLERIEPAFDLDPRAATVRGFAAAIAASTVFAALGELLPPRGPGMVVNIAVGSAMAACGLMVIWLLAPRGIATA